MRRLAWTSYSGIGYVLTITDGSDTTTALTPAAQPFVTEVAQDDDFFAPVREQTGNITIVGEVNAMEGLLASTPEDRVVTLTATNSGSTSTVWKGYLQTDSFSQPWDKGPNEISMPVVSHLGIIEGYNLEGTGYISFASLIMRMGACTGTQFYTSFVFPQLGDPLTTLYYKFSPMNYASWSDERQAYEWGSYREALEEMCKLFGWTAIESGDTLYFITPDSYTGYYKMSAAQLQAVANQGSIAYDELSAPTEIGTIYGADHTISYIQGKKSVKVTGDPNDMDMSIWKLDTSKMSQSNTQTYTGQISSGHYLHFYSKNYYSDSQLDVDTEQNNIRLQNFMAGDNDTWKGCCCVCDREYVTKSSGKNILDRDSGWMQHIIWRTPQSYGGNTMCTITPRIQHTASGMFTDCYFLITASVRRSSSYANTYEAFDGGLYLTLSVGDNVLFNGYVEVVGGKIAAETVQQMVNSPDGIGVYCGTNSGQIKLEVKVMPYSEISDEIEGLFNLYWNYYYSLENLEIKYIRPWTRHLQEPAKQNVEERQIGSGFSESLEQNNKLTTYRQDQIGWGIVLGAQMETVSTLYSGKTPEDALADRMEAHYSTSKRKITAQLLGHGSMLPPTSPVLPGSGTAMACLSQTVYWRDDMIEATLYEA